MEGAIAACLGNAAVGFLAQMVFGFDLSKDAGPGEHNAEALGKASCGKNGGLMDVDGC